ncbi:non-histone protein [Rhizina undulata]
MPKDTSRQKSPAAAHPHLPASVEQSYRQKCIDLKKRINEIESSNDVLVLRIQRARRGIQRMRLERAFLLQQLEQRTDARVEDSQGSPSPPPTPKEKPLRIKRARKDPQPINTPMRQISPSPSRDGQDSFSFVSNNFTAVNPNEMNFSVTPAQAPSAPVPVAPKAAKSSRNKGGPKRPPNAYMIFCEKERDTVRERESKKEGFDMHKALAQAWRDLKTEGQKPYFIEYERNRERYLDKVNELKGESAATNIAAITATNGAASSSSKRGGRANSAASSAVPPSNGDAPMSPGHSGSTNDEQDDQPASLGGGFTAVNR